MADLPFPGNLDKEILDTISEFFSNDGSFRENVTKDIVYDYLIDSSDTLNIEKYLNIRNWESLHNIPYDNPEEYQADITKCILDVEIAGIQGKIFY
jgi:hypothetical protein